MKDKKEYFDLCPNIEYTGKGIDGKEVICEKIGGRPISDCNSCNLAKEYFMGTISTIIDDNKQKEVKN